MRVCVCVYVDFWRRKGNEDLGREGERYVCSAFEKNKVTRKVTLWRSNWGLLNKENGSISRDIARNFEYCLSQIFIIICILETVQ